MKLGRNDPCYCGSGKKYKRCHLPIDEQAQFASTVSPSAERADKEPELEEAGTDTPESLPAWAKAALDGDAKPGAMKQLSQAFQMASRSGLFKRDPELRRVFKENEALLSYASRAEEIHAASEKLKPYYAEFEKLCRNPKAYERQSQALFAEETFVPFRFTAADLTKAFAEVGVPPPNDTSKKTGKLLRKALLLLATKERRNNLSLRLLLLMPEFVQRGRHLDALIISSCAEMTAEETDDSNPFLGAMFLHGLEAWGAEQDATRDALLAEAGLDPDADPEEIESWLEKQLADPESAARWERLLEAHPEFQADAGSTFQLMARRSVELFDRDDSARLLLGVDEIQPWIAPLLEKLHAMAEDIGPIGPGVKITRARRQKAFDQYYLPAMQEITQRIFTPERIQRLLAELRAYRKELAAADEKSAVVCATSAILYVEHEQEPELNSFLVNLCARSVMSCAPAAEEQGDGIGGASQATA